jgi:hypothetical protein
MDLLIKEGVSGIRGPNYQPEYAFGLRDGLNK